MPLCELGIWSALAGGSCGAARAQSSRRACTATWCTQSPTSARRQSSRSSRACRRRARPPAPPRSAGPLLGWPAVAARCALRPMESRDSALHFLGADRVGRRRAAGSLMLCTCCRALCVLHGPMIAQHRPSLRALAPSRPCQPCSPPSDKLGIPSRNLQPICATLNPGTGAPLVTPSARRHRRREAATEAARVARNCWTRPPSPP